ncbi:MAG: polysaccharide biosynthesis tyrosine autokinase [Opitutaceae bacterium]|nr:polysaccharide biosynthesis tyrosine autokinase [Opitutaceae bacterium]
MSSVSTGREGATLAEFAQLVRLRAGLILTLLALVVVTTAVVTALLPRWYAATAVVRVEKPEGKERLFQASSPGYIDPYFLQDQQRILQSAKVVYPVIEKLALNEKVGRMLGLNRPLPTDQTFDYMTRKMIRVDSPRASSLIELSVEAQDPQLAASIANAIVETYAEDRIAFATSEQRSGLAQLRKELEEQERTVSTQRDRVEQLRKDLSIAGVDLNARYSDMEIDTLRQMQNSLIALSVEAIGKRTRYERFKAIPVSERLNLVNSELIQDTNIQNLLQAFFVAEQTVTRMRSRFGEAHPDLVAAVDNSAKIREQLDAQLRGYESSLEIAYKEAEARVNELKNQLAQAKVDQILSARDRMRPFEESVQKLDDETRLLSTLKVNLRQREIDFQVPRRSVEILSQAESPRRSSRPSWGVNLTLAVLVGSVLGIGTAVAFELLDRSLRTLADVEAKLGKPVLAVVAWRGQESPRQTLAPEEEEPYRVLDANLGLARGKIQGTRVTLFTSAGPGEGKSTTLSRLARAAGASGARVLVVDGDVRIPSQHTTFGANRRPGVGEWLKREVETGAILQTAVAPQVDLIASGAVNGLTLTLLHADRLRELLEWARGRYDRVLLDCPPIIGVSDAAMLATLADEIVLVVQHRRNPGSMVIRAQQILKELGREITGVVLNGVPKDSGEDYGYYTSNYAYYRKTEEKGREAREAKTERIDFKE